MTKTQRCFRDGKWQVDELANLCENLERRLLLAETAVTACHSAMLGKVNPKHPAWGCVYAVQDAPAVMPNEKGQATPPTI